MEITLTICVLLIIFFFVMREINKWYISSYYLPYDANFLNNVLAQMKEKKNRWAEIAEYIESYPNDEIKTKLLFQAMKDGKSFYKTHIRKRRKF